MSVCRSWNFPFPAWDGVCSFSDLCRSVAFSPKTLLVRIRRWLYRMHLCPIRNDSWRVYDYRALARIGEDVIFAANIKGGEIDALVACAAASLDAIFSDRAVRASGNPPAFHSVVIGKPQHKRIRTPPQRPSIPKNPSARTRNAAARRESASPKTVPGA